MVSQSAQMNRITMFLILFLMSASNAWAATCGKFTLNADPGSTGSVTCSTNSGNIHYQGSNNVVESPSGIVLFSGVTDLTGSISGIYNNAPRNSSNFGTFSILANVWDSWDSIYLALKQGNGYGLFLLSKSITTGTWHTAPGKGTGLSHYLAFGGTPATTEVPLPAAFWLFGSAVAGLMGAFKKRSKQ